MFYLGLGSGPVGASFMMISPEPLRQMEVSPDHRLRLFYVFYRGVIITRWHEKPVSEPRHPQVYCTAHFRVTKHQIQRGRRAAHLLTIQESA